MHITHLHPGLKLDLDNVYIQVGTKSNRTFYTKAQKEARIRGGSVLALAGVLLFSLRDSSFSFVWLFELTSIIMLLWGLWLIVNTLIEILYFEES